MGISLFRLYRCRYRSDVRKIYQKITTKAKNLVRVGEQIETEYGIPIINKRISVTPIAIVVAASQPTPQDCVKVAKTLDRAAETVGVNFIGGYSALVEKRVSRR